MSGKSNWYCCWSDVRRAYIMKCCKENYFIFSLNVPGVCLGDRLGMALPLYGRIKDDKGICKILKRSKEMFH